MIKHLLNILKLPDKEQDRFLTDLAYLADVRQLYCAPHSQQPQLSMIHGSVNWSQLKSLNATLIV
jgi:hypothetical protein